MESVGAPPWSQPRSLTEVGGVETMAMPRDPHTSAGTERCTWCPETLGILKLGHSIVGIATPTSTNRTGGNRERFMK